MDPTNGHSNDDGSGKLLRLLRPSIVVLCGPSACGKTTFAKAHFRPTQIISSDNARGLVGDDERDQRYNPQAFALVHFLVEQRISLNRLCVVDSTALTPQARRDLLELARKYGVPTTLVLFNVPLEACAERDEKRERTVGRAVIERQYHAFEQAKAEVVQEGYGQIVEYQDSDVENVRIEILFRPVRPPARFEATAHRPDSQPRGLRPRPNGPRNGQDGGYGPRQGGSQPVGDSRPPVARLMPPTGAKVARPQFKTSPSPGEAPLPVPHAAPSAPSPEPQK